MHWNGQADYVPVRCREDMENQLINFLEENTHTHTHTRARARARLALTVHRSAVNLGIHLKESRRHAWEEVLNLFPRSGLAVIF